MKDYYKNTRKCIDTYNAISNRIKYNTSETEEDEDEFMANFCLHLAHALIKDTGFG